MASWQNEMLGGPDEFDPPPSYQPLDLHHSNSNSNGHSHSHYNSRRRIPREEPFIIWSPPHHAWYQGAQRQPHHRSRKYLVRPVDGARRGFWGRLKDALTDSGPDVFVVARGDARTLHRELPRRERWSGWDRTQLPWLEAEQRAARAHDRDWFPPTDLPACGWTALGCKSGDSGWGGGRSRYRVYNFRTRKYEMLHGGNAHRFWSDARWAQNVRREGEWPTCWREWDGTWQTTVSERARGWPGGRA